MRLIKPEFSRQNQSLRQSELFCYLGFRSIYQQKRNNPFETNGLRKDFVQALNTCRHGFPMNLFGIQTVYFRLYKSHSERSSPVANKSLKLCSSGSTLGIFRTDHLKKKQSIETRCSCDNTMLNIFTQILGKNVLFRLFIGN